MERQNQTFADHSQWGAIPLKRKNQASGQSTPENDDGKRVRMRYSKEEEEKLIREVIKRWDELYGAKSRFLPWGRKTSTWSEIAAQLGETSKGARAGEDVRKKWLYMKRVFLDKVEAQRSSTHADSGQTPPPQLTPLEQKLLSLLKQPPVQPCNVPDIGAPRMDLSPAETDGTSSGGHLAAGFFSSASCSGHPGDTDVNSSRHPAKGGRGHPSQDTDEAPGDTEASAGGSRSREEDVPEDEQEGQLGQPSDRVTAPASRHPGRLQGDDGTA
ncbi:myb-related transcription factor, partner of profilin-like [Megalops cyprinoides]|uniref:myb-related transcription factor, partner of profilin-like n=1 Tax=Megalops cyprinoides TaxID=118141 RepID=UPI00186478E9|nr:myb-related transcription factor, partner of profilin-like [Megalops cyprinoides]